MLDWGKLTKLAGPRLLLAGVVVTGMLSSQGGNGTLAFFTSTVSTSATFRAGIVDLTGVGGTNASASVLPTTAFSWETAAGGNCANILTGTDITNERMAPGHYCIAPITVKNASDEALDAYLRMRLVRNTATDAAALATPALNTIVVANDVLRTGGTLNDNTTYYYTISALARNVDNTLGETVISAVQSVVVPDFSTSGNTVRVRLSWSPVPRALAYRIWGRTSATGDDDIVATVSASVTSYIDTGAALTSGTPVGASTATSIPGPNDQLNNRLRFYVAEYTGGAASNAGDTLRASAQTFDCATGQYKPSLSTFDAQIATVANVNATGVARTPLTSLSANGKAIGRALDPKDINRLTSANATAAIATGQLNLRTGTGIATPLDESSMVTNAAATNSDTAFNIIGDDEVTGIAGTDDNGTAGEATLTSTFGTDAVAGSAKAVRYYCAAIFFPSNTGITQVGGADTDTWNTSGDAYNQAGDNAAAVGSNMYTLHITAAQKAGR